MKKKFSLIVLFFFTCSICAQNQNANPPVNNIIEKTVQKFNALSSFSIDFKMTMENNKKIMQSYTGVMLVAKDKYFLTFDDQIIANDGTVMWNYQKSTNEASLFDAKDDEFAIFHPAKLLKNWNKEYDVKFIREEEFQKKQVNIVDFTPKKRAAFYKIRLYIDKNTSYIQQIMMYDTDNNTFTYSITKFTPNVAVAGSKFTFNKKEYPNVQVNDMR